MEQATTELLVLLHLDKVMLVAHLAPMQLRAVVEQEQQAALLAAVTAATAATD